MHLADDGLDRDTTQVVQVMSELQSTKDGLLVHHLDLGVVREGCPGDVAILDRLAEISLLGFRWAVKAHIGRTGHVQRRNVGVHCVYVRLRAALSCEVLPHADGCRDVPVKVHVDDIVVVAQLRPDTAEPDILQKRLEKLCFWYSSVPQMGRHGISK